MILTELMHNLKETGIDWREISLISILNMDQSTEVRLDQRETRNMKTGRGVRQGSCLSLILFILWIECRTKGTLEGFGVFEMGDK